MTTSRRTATHTILSLAVVASLFICSNAFPTTVSHTSLDLLQRNHEVQVQQSQYEITPGKNPYLSTGNQVTRQTTPLSKTESSSSTTKDISEIEIDAPESPALSSSRRHSHQHQTYLGPYPGNSRSIRDQVLHQCTTHFLELLDSDVSDHLVFQLSRLVMMLPVIGIETRAVMRAKVVQVMQQVSSRLTNYESIRRVIRAAVDDVGLLLLDGDYTVVTNGRRGKKGTRGGIRRIHYKDPEYFEDSDEDNDYLESKGVSEDEIESSESVWGRLQDALRSSPLQRSQESDGRSSSNSDSGLSAIIDESQIPVVADVAMGAVLDYVAEILTPALVIHQLTEGIQSSLYQISKSKNFDQSNDSNDLEDGNELDFDIGALSSQSILNSDRDQHGINHLSDGWMWASPSSSDSTHAFDSDEIEDDSKGQDEDLWDKDMEIHDWDGTGRLFEDFEDTEGKEEELDQKAEDNGDNERENSDSIHEEDDSDPDDKDYLNPFAVGIQEDDQFQQGDQDDEDDDESFEVVEDYEHDGSLMPSLSKQMYLGQKQKRSMDSSGSSLKYDYSSIASNPPTVILRKRRLDFAPDLRLESLLAQLVEPVLNTFIDEDFPSNCKRAQGELMDGIIWSLDQAESTSNMDSEDQLALLSELEY